jgi:hypothetical protein
LEEEIRTLHARASWTDLDGTYRKWLKVRDVSDTSKWPIHEMAAEAAKERGDAISRYRRIVTAILLLKDGPAEERSRLKAQKKDLDDNWARVDVRLMRRLRNPITYPVPHRGIARGDGRAAFKWASEELSKGRRFDGLVPAEPFIIDGKDIPLGPDCALALASVVGVFQKKDGSFEIHCEPRPATAERNPPTLID